MANYIAPVSGTWARKGSSPFMASRSGGRRYHAGNDLQAANGSPAVAMVGGTVQYAGHNQGYQWNAVVLGDDGNAYRYATHGPLTAKVGERIEAGQQVGTIGRGHLHFEVIPPTSPAYQEMAANPGKFVSTRYAPGGSPLTVDPAGFFGVEGGARIAAGQPVGGGAAPQDAQSAIAGLIAPPGGPAVPDAPTAAMGYAPNLPADASFAPPMPQVASATPPPLPSPPPSWASGAGFPIDDALTGRTGQDVLMGGPRMDPRRAIGSAPVAPDMGSMRSPADVLAAGPRLRPGGAPDASMVPPPVSRLASGVTPPPPLSPAMPNPPPRASGIPNPNVRPSFVEMGPGIATTGAGMGAEAIGPQMQVDQPGPPSPWDDWTRAFDIPPPLSRAADSPMPERQSTQFPSMVAGRPEFPGGNTPVRDFASADPALSLPPSWSPATGFPPPPSPIGTVGAGSTGGEFFTPAPPMPSPPPDPLAGRFDDAFSPGGPSQIMDLQAAFERRNAPPTMNAQDGINSVFGAPPAEAMPPNLAIPFSEVPGFDMSRFAGAAPAEAATVASPLPMPGPPSPISMADFDARFGGGSVVRPPTPGVTPGVVPGEMPQPGAPMDIRSPAQGGPPFVPAPPASPRQTNVGAERQKKNTIGRLAGGLFGGLLGGPIGALGGGLLGGGFGGFGAQPSFAWSGGGTAPYGNGGSTTYQKGTSNALGGSNALSWTGSKGQTVTVVQDPWTGSYMTAF